MRKPVAQYKYMLDAQKALIQAGARATQKLPEQQELSDEELLGVVMAAHPELLQVRQVREDVEISTTTPVEAVLSRDGIELRRIA